MNLLEISQPRKIHPLRFRIYSLFALLFLGTLVSYFFYSKVLLPVLFLFFSLTVSLLIYWEEQMKRAVSSLVNEKVKVEREDLKNNHIECESHSREKSELAQKIQESELRLKDFATMVRDQRRLIERKDEKIAKLESRINDLTGEIRNLLEIDCQKQPSERAPPLLENKKPFLPEDFSFFELSRRLEKSIKIAEEFSPRPASSPFLELAEEISLDIPQFVARIEDEPHLLFMIYSPDERRILYVHPSVKTLTGWGREKFAKLFFHLIIRGIGEWKEALLGLQEGFETPLHIAIRDKEGHERKFQGLLGLIRKGSLANLVIALFSEI